MKHLIITIVIVIACLMIAVSPASSNDIEDLIDIQIINKQVIAIRGGRNISFIDIGLREKVQWYGSLGEIGAVLTSKQFLAISISSQGWQVYPLWVGELPQHEVLLSEYLALLVTQKQMIVFDSQNNKWSNESLPIHDKYVDAALDRNVGIVITSKRAFGYATGGSAFVEVAFRKGERYASVKTKSRDASLLTTSRLLVFSSSSKVWREIDIK